MIAFIIGLLGAGPGTSVLLVPIGFSTCAQIGTDPLLMVFAIDCGYSCGNQNPWAGTGVVLCELVELNGAAADVAFQSYFMSYILFDGGLPVFLVALYAAAQIGALAARRTGEE